MKRWLTSFKVILITAAVFRLVVIAGVFSSPQKAVLTDSKEYITIAHNMQEHGIFSSNLLFPYKPDMMRTPVYPGVLYVFSFTGNFYPCVLVLQLLLSFFTCYMVIKLTQRISPQPISAVMAGWIMALDVPSIIFTGFILTETLFTFLLLLFLWFMVLYFQQKKISHLLLSSAFLGLALLCRPIALFLPVWIIVIWLLFFRKQISYKRMGYFLLPVMFLCGLWILRNYLVFNQPFFTRIGTFNMAWFQASMTKAEAENTTLMDARWNLFTEAGAEMKTKPADDPVTFYSILARKSRQIILSYPGIALKNILKAEINLLFRPSAGYVSHVLGISDLPKNQNTEKTWQSALIYGSVGFQFLHLITLYTGMALLFAFRKKITRKHVLLFFVLLFVYFLIPGTGPEMEARFRIPLLPMLAVLSGCGYSLVCKDSNLVK